MILHSSNSFFVLLYSVRFIESLQFFKKSRAINQLTILVTPPVLVGAGTGESCSDGGLSLAVGGTPLGNSYPANAFESVEDADEDESVVDEEEDEDEELFDLIDFRSPSSPSSSTICYN